MDVEWIGKCEFRSSGGRRIAREGEIGFEYNGNGGAYDIENAGGVQYPFEQRDFVEK